MNILIFKLINKCFSVKHKWYGILPSLIQYFIKFQADVDEHVRQNAESDLLGQIYGDFESYEAKLEHDLVKFRDGTVTPVWNLRLEMQ